jgi:segregation and condensation protein B
VTDQQPPAAVLAGDPRPAFGPPESASQAPPAHGPAEAVAAAVGTGEAADEADSAVPSVESEDRPDRQAVEPVETEDAAAEPPANDRVVDLSTDGVEDIAAGPPAEDRMIDGSTAGAAGQVDAWTDGPDEAYVPVEVLGEPADGAEPADADGQPTDDAAEQAVEADEGGAPAVAEGSGSAAAAAPEPLDPARLRSAVEAILFVVDRPTTAVELAQVLDVPQPEVTGALAALRYELDSQARGFELREVAGGWRLYTREEFAPYVERYILDGQQARLTQAALETLAVVAYRQPVTRARISAIRGVSVDGVIRTLLSRGLIEECGSEPDTGGLLYRTTPLFLEKLGLQSLDDLPSLAPLLPELESVEDVAPSS